ncbi:MAG: DNA polymerase Y family protein [Gammaproteobacteria bacterium]|nr:DNA polymerase Y family protein [Gammaproteobacteria bacterium]
MAAFPLTNRRARQASLPSLLSPDTQPACPQHPERAVHARQLWLCAWFPALPLEAAGHREATPFAIVEDHGARRHVHIACAAARAAGVVTGMGLAQAYALCPHLKTQTRDTTAEARRLEMLAAWANQFTPTVSLQPPRALLLEISGSLRLFGNLENLKARLHEGLAALGAHVHVAVTPTPLASLLLASVGQTAEVLDQAGLHAELRRLPINALPLQPDAIRYLRHTGVRNFHDLWRLPRKSVARRLGPTLLDFMDRALGLRPDPQRGFHSPPRFTTGLELPWETDDADALLEAARQLLARLIEFLRAHDAGVNRLQLDLHHAKSPPSRLRIGTRHATRDAAHLLKLTEEHLHRFRLPAPVLKLRLAAASLQPFIARNKSLFAKCGLQNSSYPLHSTGSGQAFAKGGRQREPGFATCPKQGSSDTLLVPPSSKNPPNLPFSKNPALLPPFSKGGWGGFNNESNLDWRQLLEQLQARLGREAVRGLEVCADHRPERAWRCIEPDGQRSEATANRPRPLWLLPAPQQLNTRQGHPWRRGPVSIQRGPERIENGWWDGHDVRRDYYIAIDTDGSRLWIYRELRKTRTWFLHGFFA